MLVLFTYLFTFVFSSGKIFSSFSLSCQKHFIHHSGHQSTEWDCNNFSLSWITLGPQWNATRLAEDPWGFSEDEMATLILQGHHNQLIPALGCRLPAPGCRCSAHGGWSCQRLPCLSGWRGHALPLLLLILPPALSCLWTPDLDCSFSCPCSPPSSKLQDGLVFLGIWQHEGFLLIGINNLKGHISPRPPQRELGCVCV